MEKHIVIFSGRNIVDRHTHDEVSLHIGPYAATLTIPGYMYDDFRKEYGKPLKGYTITAKIEFIQNKERVPECQDLFKSPTHRMGTLRFLEEIIKVEEEKD